LKIEIDGQDDQVNYEVIHYYSRLKIIQIIISL